MSELTYVFSEAGLEASASFDGVSGINVEFFGYNQKLPALVETVLSKLANLELTKEQFDVNMERYKREIQSLRKQKAHQQMTLFHNYLMNHRGYSLKELEETLDKITYEKLMEHYKKLFEQIFVEGLIYGNADPKEAAESYGNLIQKYILKNGKVKPYELQDVMATRKGNLKIPANGITHVLRFENFNSDDNNSAIGNEYFYNLDTPKEWAAMRFLAHVASVPCFDQLRTKEQLGYLVWSSPDISRGLMSFRVIIQSVVADPIKLDERIELFLQDFRKELAAMDTKVFESNKEGIINDLLEKTKGVSHQLGYYWTEFENARYQFERRQHVAKEVTKLSLEEVLAVFDQYILGSKGTRAKLSVQCFGKDHKVPEMETKDSKIHLLTPETVLGFKDKAGYYPFPYGIHPKL